MTRSTPPLKQHLLTRSDLAQMAVPAGEVLSWLGSVALEQIGSLPGDGAADPVFTVSTPELRADLAARLAAIGKVDVVLAPERVRSFLSRVLQVGAPGISASRNSDGVELRQLLNEAVAASARETAACERIAREEVRAELESAPAANEPDAAHGDAGDGDTGGAEDDGSDLDALDACFDLADLEAVVGGGSDQQGSEPAAAELPPEPEPEAHTPGDEPAMTEEPVPIEVEHVNEAAAIEHAEAVEPAVVETAPVAAAAPHSDAGESIVEPVVEAATGAIAELADEAATESDAEPAATMAAAEPEADAELAACARTVDAIARAEERETPIERVESFLGLLKDAVLELAQRPAPQQLDMRPFVLAMQAGLDRSTQQAEVTATALETLQARVDGLGERLDDVAARPATTHVAFAPARGAAVAARPAVPEADPLATLMAGVAVLALAWSVLFWTTLDAPRLAAGTLLGANVIGCLLLSTWWRR